MATISFKQWALTEGWNIDLSNIPFEELQAQLAGKSADAVKWLVDKAKFNYYGKKDLPHDFIKVIPLNKAVEVPSVQLKRYLPSFEGVKIYYGYTFSTSAEYEDPYSAYTKRSNPNRIIQDQINRLEQDYKKYNIPSSPKKIPPPRIVRQLDTLAQQVVDSLIKMNTLTYKSSDPFLTAYQQVLNQYQNNRDIMVYFYYTYFIQLIKKEKELQNRFTTKEDSSRYLNSIKIAFSKVLKEPKTPAGAATRNLFIKQAADNFYRIMGNRKYDRVVYPESSKEFNKIFADYLAKLYGTRAIQGFSKLPAGQVTLDEPSLKLHYGGRTQDKINYLQQGGMGRPGLQTANPEKTLQIKHFPQGLRRYIKMWQPDMNFRGKRILIVDDNVDQGGTLERIHDLAIQQKPKSIDIYTPLYIGGGHGITHS